MSDHSHPKSQGAQPGNLNALKHGLYSPRFTGFEFSEMNAALQQGIAGEIAATRLLIRKLFDLSESSPDLDQASSFLHLLDLFTGRLAGLLRIYTLITFDPAEAAAKALKKALSELTGEVHRGSEP